MDIKNIYKCYLNCFNILKYRGFEIDNFKNISFNNFNKLIENYNNNNNILNIYIENDKVKCIFHFFHIEKKIDEEKIENIYNNLIDLYNLDNNKKYNIILISTFNDIDIELIKEIKNKFGIVFFYYKSLVIDIMKHKYVPEHIKLSNNEKNQLKNNINLKSFELLPYISEYDPVSKILGLEYGDVCKIIRNNKNVGNNIYYRFCCN
jgi:DNA-directed RNA polymerase subunit H (RpoH/RPB5)